MSDKNIEEQKARDTSHQLSPRLTSGSCYKIDSSIFTHLSRLGLNWEVSSFGGKNAKQDDE